MSLYFGPIWNLCHHLTPHMHHVHDSPLSITYCTCKYWVCVTGLWQRGYFPKFLCELEEPGTPFVNLFHALVLDSRLQSGAILMALCTSYPPTAQIDFPPTHPFAQYSPPSSPLTNPSCFPLLGFVCSLLFLPALWCSACAARGHWAKGATWAPQPRGRAPQQAEPGTSRSGWEKGFLILHQSCLVLLILSN